MRVLRRCGARSDYVAHVSSSFIEESLAASTSAADTSGRQRRSDARLLRDRVARTRPDRERPDLFVHLSNTTVTSPLRSRKMHPTGVGHLSVLRRPNSRASNRRSHARDQYRPDREQPLVSCRRSTQTPPWWRWSVYWRRST